MPPENPQTAQSPGFGDIALCLSGGGYRAAAFHLGTLDLLYRVGLLERVTMLSTVSGGTITGAAYAAALARGENFAQFYERLQRFLSETNLPALWLDDLGRQRQENPLAPPSLIKAAARVYDQKLFNPDERFSLLLDRPTHLKKIVFNATELRTGLGFRFQKAAPRAISGNKFNRLPQPLLREVRLADAVAASSCFPGGFEPLYFPDDFAGPAGGWQALLDRIPKQFDRKEAAAALSSPVPLVDGGIYDNQGIEALLLADGRSSSRGAIGTWFISDTDNIQPSESLMGTPRLNVPEWLRRLTLGQLAKLVRAGELGLLMTAGILLLSLLGAVASGRYGWWELLVLVAFFATAILSAAYAWANWAARRLLPQQFEALGFDVSFADFWKRVARLTIVEAASLASLRTLTISAMVPTFLKRTRSLIYKKLYSNRNYQNRCISNLIYEFLPDVKAGAAASSEEEPSPDSTAPLRPTAAMKRLAQQATATPTTLWFDGDETATQVKMLIACGQCTTCYNLLDFIDTTTNIELPPSSDMLAVRNEAMALWQELQQDALALVSEPSQPGSR